MGYRKLERRDLREGLVVFIKKYTTSEPTFEEFGYIYKLGTGNSGQNFTILRYNGNVGCGCPIEEFPYNGKQGWNCHVPSDGPVDPYFIKNVEGKHIQTGGLTMKSELATVPAAPAEVKKVSVFDLELKRTDIGFDLIIKSPCIETIIKNSIESENLDLTKLHFTNKKNPDDTDNVDVYKHAFTNETLGNSISTIKRLGNNYYSFSSEKFIYKRRDNMINFGFLATKGIENGITIHHKSLLMDKAKLKELAEDIKNVIGALFTISYENVIIKTSVTSYIQEF